MSNSIGYSIGLKGYPSLPICEQSAQYRASIGAVDEQFTSDVLIGCDYYWGPTAIRTKLGWVLSGPTRLAFHTPS